MEIRMCLWCSNKELEPSQKRFCCEKHRRDYNYHISKKRKAHKKKRPVKPAVDYIDKCLHRNNLTATQIKEIASYYNVDAKKLKKYLEEHPNEPKRKIGVLC
jgi:phage antirepressor YoqD-like protein